VPSSPMENIVSSSWYMCSFYWSKMVFITCVINNW